MGKLQTSTAASIWAILAANNSAWQLSNYVSPYAPRNAHAPSPITASMPAGCSRVNIVLPIVKHLLTPVHK